MSLLRADMAGGFKTSSGEMGAIFSLNVTPFVDVVLALLVIFMVTAPVLMKDAIGLRLPKAASADTKTANPLGIAVTEQGQILINGQLADAVTVSAQVQQAVKDNPEVQ